MKKVLEKRLKLEEERIKDFETLFSYGKISVLELSDESLERLKLIKELNDAETELLAAEKSLREKGFFDEAENLSEEKTPEAFESFLKNWLYF